MVDRAPNVPDTPDAGHSGLNPFAAVKKLFPGSKAAGSFEVSLHFVENLALTLGAVQQQNQDTAKLLHDLYRMVVEWTDPPTKNEYLYVPANTTPDPVVLNTEAGERWLLDTVISLPADGNPAHTPDTLFIVAGLAANSRLPIPNGATAFKQPLNTPVHLQVSQTSAALYPTMLIFQFRREYRYEANEWTAGSKE